MAYYDQPLRRCAQNTSFRHRRRSPTRSRDRGWDRSRVLILGPAGRRNGAFGAVRLEVASRGSRRSCRLPLIVFPERPARRMWQHVCGQGGGHGVGNPRSCCGAAHRAVLWAARGGDVVRGGDSASCLHRSDVPGCGPGCRGALRCGFRGAGGAGRGCGGAASGRLRTPASRCRGGAAGAVALHRDSRGASGVPAPTRIVVTARANAAAQSRPRCSARCGASARCTSVCRCSRSSIRRRRRQWSVMNSGIMRAAIRG